MSRPSQKQSFGMITEAIGRVEGAKKRVEEEKTLSDFKAEITYLQQFARQGDAETVFKNYSELKKNLDRAVREGFENTDLGLQLFELSLTLEKMGPEIFSKYAGSKLSECRRWLGKPGEAISKWKMQQGIQAFEALQGIHASSLPFSLAGRRDVFYRFNADRLDLEHDYLPKIMSFLYEKVVENPKNEDYKKKLLNNLLARAEVIGLDFSPGKLTTPNGSRENVKTLLHFKDVVADFDRPPRIA